MKSLERVDDHAVDFLLSLVHFHFAVLGEKLPDRILANLKARVMQLLIGRLIYRVPEGMI